MANPLEIRCEKCDRLYAWAEPEEGGFVLHVQPSGMKLRILSEAERMGQVVCECGHRTPVDLALVGFR